MNKLSNGLRVGLAYISEFNNRSQSINRFPPEVLSTVFLQLKVNYTYCDIPPGSDLHYECLRTFSVCRYWRTVALGCSELWTCVYLSPNTIDIAELFCLRSARRPLSLVVRNFEESKSPIRMRDLLKTSSERVKKLVTINCRIPKWPEMIFPIMTILINRYSVLGPQNVPDNQQRQKKKPINLQHASFQFTPPLLNTLSLFLPKLTSLHLDLSYMRSTERPMIVRTGAITDLLDTQPNLQELILEGVPPLSHVDPETAYPRALSQLKRLGFYRSYPASICSILSYIQHFPTMAIAIDMTNQWGDEMAQADIAQFLAQTIPDVDPGYTGLYLSLAVIKKTITVPFQPAMVYSHLYAFNITLTGSGGVYGLTASVKPETKDKILTCLASSGRLRSLKTIWTPSPADLVILQIYAWLPSAFQLAQLSFTWSPALWAQPNSMGDLFSALPQNLTTLVMHILPFTDDAIATSNFDNIITLNKRRPRPVKIVLSFRVDPKRRAEILAKYPCITQSEHVETWPWPDARLKLREFSDVSPEVDILTTRHNYWPSWMNTQEAEQCRLAREA